MRNNSGNDFSFSDKEPDAYLGLSESEIKRKEKKKLIWGVVIFLTYQSYIFYQYYIGEVIVPHRPNVFLENGAGDFYFALLVQELFYLCFLMYGVFDYYINKSVLFPKS